MIISSNTALASNRGDKKHKKHNFFNTCNGDCRNYHLSQVKIDKYKIAKEFQKI